MAAVTSRFAKVRALLVVFAVTFGGFIFHEPTTVEAYVAQSPTRCDGTPKYWCHYIVYDVSPPNYTTLTRYYQGSRGCTATCPTQRWRLDNSLDYRWDGSAWQISYQSPTPGQWFTNPSFDGYKTMGGQHTMYGSGLVAMLNGYQDYTMSQGTSNWWGNWTYHYLT